MKAIKARGKTAEVLIYEDIGAPFGGIDGPELAKAIRALKVDRIDLRINSWGGLVNDGILLYNTLASHPAQVTTYIDGLAASIASVVAMGGTAIHIADNAQMMIHEAWTLASGTAAELRKAAEDLERNSGIIRGIYAKKTGRPEDEIAGLMAAETWMTADEAKRFGFADTVFSAGRMAAMTRTRIPLGSYRHPPAHAAAINQATLVKAARMSNLLKRRGLQP